MFSQFLDHSVKFISFYLGNKDNKLQQVFCPVLERNINIYQPKGMEVPNKFQSVTEILSQKYLSLKVFVIFWEFNKETRCCL